MVSGMANRMRAAASRVRRSSFCPGRYGAGAAERRVTARARHSRQAIIRTSRERTPAGSSGTCQSQRALAMAARAPAPERPASSFRHRGRGCFGSFPPPRVGASHFSGGYRSAPGGSGGSGETPPQAAMTSSGVTAPGSRCRAIRLAAVV